MSALTLVSKRFDELNLQLEGLEGTLRSEYWHHLQAHVQVIDEQQYSTWKARVATLIIDLCGESSDYFRRFVASEERTMMETSAENLRRTKAVFLALKQDYEGGYLVSIKALIEAELFDDELEQSEELFRSNYFAAAAIIAGVVIETNLRRLATSNGSETGKLDKMNADLAKRGVLTKLEQKQITVWAGVRNEAAHGGQAFTKDDVASMIAGVRNFLVLHQR